MICAVVLLMVFSVLTRAMLVQGQRSVPAEAHARAEAWSLATAVGVLLACGVAAVLVSDWFVEALEPAINALGISQAFAGLGVVAIAGNAVENVVGIRFAAEGKADLAVSVVLNSALQVAVALIPILIAIALSRRAKSSSFWAILLSDCSRAGRIKGSASDPASLSSALQCGHVMGGSF